MAASYIDEVTGEIVHIRIAEVESNPVEEIGLDAVSNIAEDFEAADNTKSLAHLISLINDFDSQTVLQAVSPKLFDHFTIWDLIMAKSNLNLDKGVLNVVVDDILVILSELKILIEQCLDPVLVGEVAIKKRSGESVKFDQMITQALGLESNLFSKRDPDDIKYPHTMFSPKYLFPDKKKDADFTKVRIKKENDKDTIFVSTNTGGNGDDENEVEDANEGSQESPLPAKRIRKATRKAAEGDEDFEPSKRQNSPKKPVVKRGKKRKAKSSPKQGVEEIEKKGDYICGKCSKTYLNFTAWYKHMEKSCASRASLKVSIRTVDNKYYCAYKTCSIPKKPFRTKDDVHDHWALNHVEESKKIIPCFMCSLKFATVGAKKLHMNKVHVKAQEPPTPDVDESEELKSKEKYLCLKCGQSINKERGKKHEEKCNGMYVRRPEYKKVNDEFFCTVEGCNVGYGFSSMYGLRKHFHTTHTSEEEKFFLCDFCDEKFSFKTARNKHITEKHLKKYVCDLCGKGFGGKSSMMQHRILHTGEKPFACTTCDYRAAKKSNLEAHMETKHNIFRQKSFMCAICQKQFVTMGRVQRHMNEIHGEGAEEKKRKRGARSATAQIVSDPNDSEATNQNETSQNDTTNQSDTNQPAVEEMVLLSVGDDLVI